MVFAKVVVVEGFELLFIKDEAVLKETKNKDRSLLVMQKEHFSYVVGPVNRWNSF